jgi:hypothetical protein
LTTTRRSPSCLKTSVRRSLRGECTGGTVALRSPPDWLPALSVARVACKLGCGVCLRTVGRRSMRALGVVLVLSGLAVAVFALRPGVPDQADAAHASRPSAAPVLQTVYVPATRSASVPTATAAPGSAGAAHLDLVRELQHELTRIGCYAGDVNGIWTPSTRRAMDALIERANAKLPTTRPEPVHLALAQGQQVRLCDRCAGGEHSKSGASCANPAAVAVFAPTGAPLPSPERAAGHSEKRRPIPKPKLAARSPAQARMGLGVNGIPTQAAEPAAKRSSADHGSRAQASRHRQRTFLAQRPRQYLRPMRPMRFAYRRPWRGIFAGLFGW